MLSATKTVLVSHLGGIEVGFRTSTAVLDNTKPTLVMFNPFTTTTDYYTPEFESEALTTVVNLVAIEPLGHGHTRAVKTDSFTYWDSAIISFQLLDILGIDEVFALGTSQGGWIAARMAILAPERIQGIIPIGSSMDAESARSRDVGCWDGPSACAGLLSLAGDLSPADNFEPGDAYYEFLMDIGFGKTVHQRTKAFWAKVIRKNYSGDQGKRRICMAAVNLAGRDGLHERLAYVKCPVLWLQGADDVVFSLRNAEEEIKLFTNSIWAKVVPFDGGVHFLSYTHEQRVHQELIEFITKWKRTVGAVL